MKPISQREARRLRKRVRMFEQMARWSWQKDWPDDSVCVLVLTKGYPVNDSDLHILLTARQLGHAVVAVPNGNSIEFFALRDAK